MQLETLQQLIATIVVNKAESDDDKLLAAVLNEISEKIYSKLYTHQNEYQLTFTPAQAFAIRLLYTDYVQTPTSYIGNKLHQVSNQIHQHFNC